VADSLAAEALPLVDAFIPLVTLFSGRANSLLADSLCDGALLLNGMRRLDGECLRARESQKQKRISYH
jgi:hypothetical protein